MICLLKPTTKKDKGDDAAAAASASPCKDTSIGPDSPPSSTMPSAGEDTGEKTTKGECANSSSGDATTTTTTKKQPRQSFTAIYADDVEVPLQTIADCGKHLDYYEKSRLRVGIIIHTTQTRHRALAALASPASSCKVTALAVLQPPPSFSMVNLKEAACEDSADDDDDEADDNDNDDNNNSSNGKPHQNRGGHLTPGSIMRKWMKDNNLGSHSEVVAVLGGEEGAKQIVRRDDVDAIFLIVPDEIHGKYAISALENRKHVLVNDPVSISLQAFNEQLEYARRFGKFVQSSTAFINQYRVRHFMECVLREQDFGRVTSMDAHLSVCSKDFALVGVNQPPLPLGANQGCIRRLGRYCVLFSILLFMKLGSHPVSVQVHEATINYKKKKSEQDKSGDGDGDSDDVKQPAQDPPEPTKAKCTVKYSNDRKATFNVSYSTASATRQRLEVKTDTSMATMSDFVFPHPDGLATYRVYEDVKETDESTGIMEAMHGEAIDIAGGPTHDVVMWRKFAELSRSVDEAGWDGDSPLTERVRELAEITLHTKTILNALMKSLEEGCVEVQL